jgi:hypothetical protein
MLKKIECKECGGTEIKKYVCDTCGLEMNVPYISVADVTNPTAMQELNKHFCSEKCLMDDSISEYNKRNPQKDILYGKQPSVECNPDVINIGTGEITRGEEVVELNDRIIEKQEIDKFNNDIESLLVVCIAILGVIFCSIK